MPYPLYFIFDGVGPVDGEFIPAARVINAVGNYSTADYQVFGFDPKTQKVENVTEAIAHQWWDKCGEGESHHVLMDHDRSSLCFLAKQYFSDEIDAMEARIYAKENAADRWRDERVGAW